MDEIKWYENSSLESIKNIIKDNINTTSRSFVVIGYYLKNVRERELYLQDGYKNILEFAKGEFNISESWANKWMRINDRFSKDGNSPILLDEYKGFGSSVLAEMITLTDEQLGLVTLTTTRAEIRSIKQQSKKEKELLAPAPVELESESEDLELDCFNNEEGWHKEKISRSEVEVSEQEKWLIRCSVLKVMCNALCKMHSHGLEKDKYSMDAIKRVSSGTYSFGFGDDGEGHSKYDAEFKNSQYIVNEFDGERSWIFESGEVDQSIWNFNGRDWHWSHRKLDQALEPVNDTPISTNDEDRLIVHEKECSNCNYNDMSPEEFRVIDPDGGLPCNECDDKLSHWIPKIEMANNEFEQDEPEIVEADIIQTAPEEDKDQEVIDPESYTCQDIRDELNKLIEYVGMYRKNNDTAPGRRKAKMRLDAMVLLDEEMRKPPVIEESEPVQPELPKLKNNDQRKEWAENYKSWGEWYYDENIDCYYYKYDFPNGDRLIVEEYRDREVYWNADKCDEKHYHLLRKEKKSYGNKNTYEEKFTHQTSSMSEIVEYLKEIQKKGA